MRLHCVEHGYLDQKTGPMAECPYCRVDELEQQLKAQINCAGEWRSKAEKFEQQNATLRAEINRRDEYCMKCENDSNIQNAKLAEAL